MLGTGLLVFREVLEAALIISVVCAATRGVVGRGRYVSAGVGLGALGAVVVALFAGRIAEGASGVGQELFNATVLFAAVLMIAWHVIWMATRGRELALQMKSVGEAVRHGDRSLAVLLFVVALAVLREGSEVVLFLYGIAASGSGAASLVVGSIGGVVCGAAVGAALYFGLLRIPIRHFFTATNWLLILLAAGMASQAAGFLIQADLLPALGNRVWDSSHLLSEESVFGHLLHVLIGYDARPAGIQLVFYVVTATLIIIGTRIWGRASRPREVTVVQGA